jgi:hypothetical protein
VRPGIVHRLDKGTTGLVVVAKSDAAHASLAQQVKGGGGRSAELAQEGALEPWNWRHGPPHCCSCPASGLHAQRAELVEHSVASARACPAPGNPSSRPPGGASQPSAPSGALAVPTRCACCACRAVQGPQRAPHLRLRHAGRAAAARRARRHKRGQVCLRYGAACVPGLPGLQGHRAESLGARCVHDHSLLHSPTHPAPYSITLAPIRAQVAGLVTNLLSHCAHSLSSKDNVCCCY